MSLTFKLLSLVIRTAAKPIGVSTHPSKTQKRQDWANIPDDHQNYIKRQAREHDGFRRFAIARAQFVHRVDMRMRLGILHDADAQQRMHEREQKAAEEKKRKAEAPTVRSELEQKQHDEEKLKAGTEDIEAAKKKKDESPKVKIRPLSEAKAIELGANFFSETFIFAVAAGLLIWDSWRSRKKENQRRDDVAERLGELETEVSRLRLKYEPQLEALVEKVKPETKSSWWNPAGWWARTEGSRELEGREIPAVVSESRSIPGSVPGVDPDKAVRPKPSTSSKPSSTTGPATTKDVTKKVNNDTKAIVEKTGSTSPPPSSSEQTNTVVATNNKQ
ncbi:hypothetical protein LTR62_007742 [Meristemomyces frigidus]|uniref:OPA3-like protein n=1 Tax=Meristemomyces frigidus TaxID=1508187 RepID=A0AAN7TIK9_9PEZI|nr:hypothetical protein LTR62_007742 [Meristemomyces frigidus]